MDSKRRRTVLALADCTNTPAPTRRPRRSCGAYGNDRPNQSSPDPASESREAQKEGKKKKKRNSLIQRAELNDDENRPQLQLQGELPVRSSAFSDDSSAIAGGRADDHEAENPVSDDQNLHTPQAVLPAVSSARIAESNDDSGLWGFRVYSKRRQTGAGSAESLSLSCPPLGRAAIGSVAAERSQEYIYHGVQIRSTAASTDLPESGRQSTGASIDLPESGRRSRDSLTHLPESGKPKKKMRRRRNSMPERGGQNSLPEDFIRAQRAHFAEVDAFELQEEDLSDAD